VKTNKFAIGIVFVWAVVGAVYGLSDRWPSLRPLQEASASLHGFSQVEKNNAFQGSVYKAYQALRETPESTRILYLIPDINQLARAVFFLYPRHITAVASPRQAIAAFGAQPFDYVLIYMVDPTNGGYVPMAWLQGNWNAEDLREFVSQVTGSPSLSQDELVEGLRSANGTLLYKSYE